MNASSRAGPFSIAMLVFGRGITCQLIIHIDSLLKTSSWSFYAIRPSASPKAGFFWAITGSPKNKTVPNLPVACGCWNGVHHKYQPLHDRINPKDCQVASPLVIQGFETNSLGLFQGMTWQTPCQEVNDIISISRWWQLKHFLFSPRSLGK